MILYTSAQELYIRLLTGWTLTLVLVCAETGAAGRLAWNNKDMHNQNAALDRKDIRMA